jgi:hopanoid biosynthesis associated RND transporter like protein HpnN
MNLPSAAIARMVGVCVGHARLVAACGLLFSAAMTGYVVGHFAMTTDTYALLSPKLAWRMRETAFNAAFPPDGSNIVVVVDGRTPESGAAAAAALTERLRAQPALFRAVRRPDAGPFWAHNALLFASTDDVKSVTDQLIKAQPFLGPLAADPSLRGLSDMLANTLQGVASGQASLEELGAPIRALLKALQDLAAGTPTDFSWSTLVTGQAPTARELRHIVLVNPVLDFTQLQPGQRAIDAIRAAMRSMPLESQGVRMRLTGPVPLQDEEFATLAEGAGLIAVLAIAAIVLMLWLAVRSWRLIACILATTLVGLATAAALGLAVFHRFNVISVAFIPLFVGLGLDLGIQFSVRYRAVHRPGADLRPSLDATAREMGGSLTLAATSIAVGFLAFAPTAYLGVSQLGVIAGLGMLVALFLNLTLLPSLIALTRPPGAPDRPPDVRLTLIDDYVVRHRRVVLAVSIGAAAISAAMLPLLHFDFNPMHLRSAGVESVATMLELMREPDQSPNTLEVIRPTLAAADLLAARLRTDPTVSSVRTLSSFVPPDQAQKIALIADASDLLDLTLDPAVVAPPPGDAQVVDSLMRTAAGLRRAVTNDASLRADAGRLADALTALASAPPAERTRAAGMLMPGLVTVIAQIRDLLRPQSVSVATLPADLSREWLTPDGRARISILPKGDSNDIAVLDRFIAACVAMAPDVTGTAISLQAGGQAVVHAFFEAGALSFIAISALLWLALRRIVDVAITMAPIVLTGLLTMGTCVLIRQPLNFANIIALPLLFGIGVAFHIYFVMAWRSGGSHLLTSSLARGVFFSALATATGFGSLWASSHPGTASMGKLLMISLVWTLVSALIFQPALMGPARDKGHGLTAS